jgi:hypothetical protein
MNGTSCLPLPHPTPYLPRRGSELSWVMGQGANSVSSPCLQQRGLCISEIGFFISHLVVFRIMACSSQE